MTSPADHDAWLDARLRAVPLPERLLERLCAITEEGASYDLADEGEDPAQTETEDREIDHTLQDVPLPDGLVPRLEAVVWEDNNYLDAALRDVAVSEQLLMRLRHIPQAVRRPLPLVAPAVAALLFVGLWSSYLAAVGQFAARHAVALQAQAATPMLLSEAPADVPPHEAALFAGKPVRLRGELSDFGPLDLDIPPAERGALSGRGQAPGWLPGSASPNYDLLADSTHFRWPVFGARGSFDDLPELKKVAGLAPRGVPVPVVPGFDLSFFIRTGVHPFVSPAANSRLQTSVVPLAVDRASYELTRRYLEDNELPPPATVRTEEFIAAVDYQYPRPKNDPLTLVAAAGPSPYRGDPRRMLHVGVQAQEMARAKRSPVRLTLLVDASASMAWGGRLEIVRRGLNELMGQLEPRDRLDLLSFSEQAQLHGEDIARGDAEQVTAVLAKLKPQGPTNLAAALREAYAIALRGTAPPGITRRVVLLSDGLAELDRVTADLIAARVADAARQGVTLEVIDLSPSMEDANDRQLGVLSQAGRGQVHRATDFDQLRWALGEIVSGQSQRVARDVTLKVKFNPQAVAEYRLLGHEAAAVAGLLPAAETCDFFSGESGTALYEFVLRPGGNPALEVATIEVTWRDLRSGQARNLRRAVLRSQIAGTLGQTPPWFQAGAFAAEFAELLRESPFTRGGLMPGNWSTLLDSLNFIDSRLQQRPSFADCVSLARRAEKAKPVVRLPRR